MLARLLDWSGIVLSSLSKGHGPTRALRACSWRAWLVYFARQVVTPYTFQNHNPPFHCGILQRKAPKKLRQVEKLVELPARCCCLIRPSPDCFNVAQRYAIGQEPLFAGSQARMGLPDVGSCQRGVPVIDRTCWHIALNEMTFFAVLFQRFFSISFALLFAHGKSFDGGSRHGRQLQLTCKKAVGASVLYRVHSSVLVCPASCSQKRPSLAVEAPPAHSTFPRTVVQSCRLVDKAPPVLSSLVWGRAPTGVGSLDSER